MAAKLIIGNWKSNKNTQEASIWIERFLEKATEVSENTEVVVAPAFTLLPSVVGVLEEVRNGKPSKTALEVVPEVVSELLPIKLATQDLSPFLAGSYTGAVSARNLENLRVEYALLGHSERRRYFHETHQDVARKVDQALLAGIKPVVCVDSEYIQVQASAIEDSQLKKCVIAYEPVEAIGTGRNVDVGQVKRIVDHIYNTFGKVKVLYGGSVTSDNVAEYTLVTDGVLVGGASLDPEEFLKICQRASGQQTQKSKL